MPLHWRGLLGGSVFRSLECNSCQLLAIMLFSKGRDSPEVFVGMSVRSKVQGLEREFFRIQNVCYCSNVVPVLF